MSRQQLARVLMVVLTGSMSIVGCGDDAEDEILADSAVDALDAGRDPSDASDDGGSAREDGGDAEVDDGLNEAPACASSGWCWETPRPAGGPIMELAASAPGQVVARSAGFLFHADLEQVRWAVPPPPTQIPHSAQHGLWAAAPDDVWVRVFRHLIHYDGSGWTEARTLDLPAVSVTGTAGDDVWVVEPQRVHHFDGSTWSDVPLAGLDVVNLTAGWAAARRRVVLTGQTLGDSSPFAWLLHGTEVTDLELPAEATTGVVYASGPDDVWVGGVGRAEIHHLSDGSWSSLSFGPPGLIELWGAGPGEVWIARGLQIDHITGDSSETFVFEGASQPVAIGGTSDSDVWVADVRGQLHHYDGTSWSVVHGEGVLDGDFESISVDASGEGWAAGWSPVTRETVLAQRAPDGTWTPAESPTPPAVPRAIAGVRHAGGETFLFVYDGSFRWDGAAWQRIGGDAGGLVDACATSDGIIRATGDRMASWDGTVWVDEGAPLDDRQRRIFCLGSEAWTAPRSGSPLHFDGADWSPSTEIEDLVGVGLHSDGTVLAVDEAGAIQVREDGVWRTFAEGPFPSVPGLRHGTRAHVSSENDIWLLWSSGLLHFDGTGWTAADPVGTLFVALEPSPDGALYASGFHAAVASLRP